MNHIVKERGKLSPFGKIDILKRSFKEAGEKLAAENQDRHQKALGAKYTLQMMLSATSAVRKGQHKALTEMGEVG